MLQHRKTLGFLVVCAVLIFVMSAPCKAGNFFSHFEISEAAVKGHKLHIRGETDLPKGSVIHVQLKAPFIDNGPGKAPNVKVHLNGKHFFVQISLPKGVKKGNLLSVGLLFRPSNQGKQVQNQVGKHGEKLKGHKVKFSNGEKTLVTWKEILL